MSTQRDTPSLAAVIRRALDARLVDVHTAVPAEVLEYDAATQKVTAQPLLRRAYWDESGERIAEKLAPIPGVPVAFPGSGGFRVTFPVVVGDTVLLVFSEASLDKWLSHGGDVDPVDDARHELSDAIAIPGLRDFGHALGDAPTNRMSMGYDSGPTIEIDESEVRLGSNGANDPVALKSDLDALKTWLNAHTHGGSTPGTPWTGATCATKVKAE